MRLIDLKEAPHITLRIESRGHHSGQSDLAIVAYDGRDKIGWIDYSVYEEQPSIQMIEVDNSYKRQGIAKMMLLRLQKEYPTTEINWGMLTMDGERLYQSMKWKKIPNQENQMKFDAIRRLTDAIKKHQDKVNSLVSSPEKFQSASDKDRELVQIWFDWKDELQDLKDEIAQYNLKPYKNIMTESKVQAINENKDYALAKRLFRQLSANAQSMIKSWEFANWHTGDLTTAFETNSEVAQEIMKVGQPIRDQIKKRHGQTITLFRGIDSSASEKTFRASRALYSWTSSEDMAKQFAGADYRSWKVKPITDQEINAAIKRYNKVGFTSFRGRKYKINKDMPQYYDIYDRNNNYITDGDDLLKEFKWLQERYDEIIARGQFDGRVVKKEIPVDDIVWVLMGGNSNEYIVNGHPE